MSAEEQVDLTEPWYETAKWLIETACPHDGSLKMSGCILCLGQAIYDA